MANPQFIVVPAFVNTHYVGGEPDFRMPTTGQAWPLLLGNNQSGVVKYLVLDIDVASASDSDMQSWSGVITNCRQAGILVWGYIGTGNGQQPLATMKAQVDKWFRNCSPDGIFFDEGGPTGTIAGLYQPLHDYIKQTYGQNKAIMINLDPSQTDQSILAATDFVIAFEGTHQRYTTWNGGLWTNNHLDQVMHTVYATGSGDVANAVQRARTLGPKYLYIFDGTSQAYDHLPTYWLNEVQLLAPPPPPPADFRGTPSLIQSHFGHKGNFELVVPLANGGLAHYWRDNDDARLAWHGPAVFGTGLGQIDAVTLIQSNFGTPGLGSLEVIARAGTKLYHFWREDSGAFAWHGPIQIP